MPEPRYYESFNEFLGHLRELATNPAFKRGGHRVFLFPETPFPNDAADNPRAEIAAVQGILREHQPNAVVAYSKFNAVIPTSEARRKALERGHQTEAQGVINNVGYLVAANTARLGAKAMETNNERHAAQITNLTAKTRKAQRDGRLTTGKRAFPQCELGPHKLELRVCADAGELKNTNDRIKLIPASGLPYISGIAGNGFINDGAKERALVYGSQKYSLEAATPLRPAEISENTLEALLQKMNVRVSLPT